MSVMPDADSALPSATRLDTATIIDTALALASEKGAKSVTVRQLGARLGADPTAIYRHFRNKDDLMRGLLDEILGIADSQISVAPNEWQDYLRESAEHTFTTFLKYPSIGAEAMRLNSGAKNELANIEGILSAFWSAGLDGGESVRHYGIFSGFVLSFCSGSARSIIAESSRKPSGEFWVDTLSATKAAHPNISEQRDALLALRDREIFQSAVELIINEAARLGARPKPVKHQTGRTRGAS